MVPGTGGEKQNGRKKAVSTASCGHMESANENNRLWSTHFLAKRLNGQIVSVTHISVGHVMPCLAPKE